MFFNRNKKIAEEISIAVSNTFRPPFMFTKYLSSNGVFTSPLGFYTDLYVLGFINGLIGMFITFDYQGAHWSPEKKGLIILQVFRYLASEEEAKKMSEILVNFVDYRDNSEVRRGVNDAQTMYGAMTGRIKPDDPDPVLTEARKLAKVYEKMDFGMGPVDVNTGLGIAVGELTIHKHIKEKYIPEKYNN